LGCSLLFSCFEGCSKFWNQSLDFPLILFPLQLSSPVGTRNILEDLHQRFTNRGSREATPTPTDTSAASPDGAASPGTTPPKRDIIDEIKDLLTEKKEKFEEGMNKRKASRGAASTEVDVIGYEEAPVLADIQMASIYAFEDTSGPSGLSPSRGRAQSSPKSPRQAQMLVNVRPRSASLEEGESPEGSPSHEPAKAREAIEGFITEEENEGAILGDDANGTSGGSCAGSLATVDGTDGTTPHSQDLFTCINQTR
jgi:hypothetical protein